MSSGLGMVWITLGHDGMSNSGLRWIAQDWMEWMTLGHDAMSNSRLQWIDQGYVNSLGLWAPGSMTDRLEEESDTQTPGQTTHGRPNDEGLERLRVLKKW